MEAASSPASSSPEPALERRSTLMSTHSVSREVRVEHGLLTAAASCVRSNYNSHYKIPRLYTLCKHVRVYKALETLWCAPNSARCGLKALAAVRAASPRMHFFIASSRKCSVRGHSRVRSAAKAGAHAPSRVLREAVVATCAAKAATLVYTFAHVNKVVNEIGLLCSQRGPTRVHTVYLQRCLPDAQLRVVRTELLRPSR